MQEILRDSSLSLIQRTSTGRIKQGWVEAWRVNRVAGKEETLRDEGDEE
jgi:hypothetical protein